MADPIVFPGTVEWSGENPGISLKETPGRPVRRPRELLPRRAVAAWPRPCAGAAAVAAGRQPAGGARELLLPRQRDAGALSGQRLRLAFRRLQGPARASAAWSTGRSTASRRPAIRPAPIARRCRAGDLTVRLTWSGLGKPFCFALPPDKSATGKHHMPSLFVGCQDATVAVNGRALAGQAGAARDRRAHHHHRDAGLLGDVDPRRSHGRRDFRARCSDRSASVSLLDRLRRRHSVTSSRPRSASPASRSTSRGCSSSACASMSACAIPNDFPLDVERLLFDLEVNDHELGQGWTTARLRRAGVRRGGGAGHARRADLRSDRSGSSSSARPSAWTIA